MRLCGPTTNRFKHRPSAVVLSVWSGDLLVDCANLAKLMVSWSRTCWTNYGPRPPHIILIIHVLNAFRASPFFTTILLPCIIVSANWRRKNGVGKYILCIMYYVLCTVYYVLCECCTMCGIEMQYYVCYWNAVLSLVPRPSPKSRKRV